MNFTATPKTALLAGAGTALGMSSLEFFERLYPVGIPTHNILFFSFAVAFLFVPVTLFVAGLQHFRFGICDVTSKEYWLSLRAVGFRGLCWLLGAALGWAMLGLLEMLLTAFR